MGLEPVVAPEKVLVTGCSGFIGRALAAGCLREGMTVRGSVRSEAGRRRLPQDVEPVYISDIGPETDWSAALRGVEAVVHLAACVHQLPEGRTCLDAEHYRVNALGTDRLAQAAAAAGVRRFVFLSSVKVHGEGRETPYTEDDRTAPQGPYAASKLAAEHALRRVAGESRMQVVVLRPPLVYGPGVGGNFNRLIRLVERRIPLPFASVHNRRSLVYVGDLVAAILAGLKHPAAAGRTFLVANDDAPATPTIIREIAQALTVRARLFPCPPRLLHVAGSLLGKRAEFRRLTETLWVVALRIRRELGWRPTTPLSEGLTAAVAAYRRDTCDGARA
jgi:nucleoside-diphosphate-sugar epimerase